MTSAATTRRIVRNRTPRNKRRARGGNDFSLTALMWFQQGSADVFEKEGLVYLGLYTM
jgi:hypothetical protein